MNSLFLSFATPCWAVELTLASAVLGYKPTLPPLLYIFRRHIVPIYQTARCHNPRTPQCESSSPREPQISVPFRSYFSDVREQRYVPLLIRLYTAQLPAGNLFLQTVCRYLPAHNSCRSSYGFPFIHLKKTCDNVCVHFRAGYNTTTDRILTICFSLFIVSIRWSVILNNGEYERETCVLRHNYIPIQV